MTINVHNFIGVRVIFFVSAFLVKEQDSLVVVWKFATIYTTTWSLVKVHPSNRPPLGKNNCNKCIVFVHEKIVLKAQFRRSKRKFNRVWIWDSFSCRKYFKYNWPNTDDKFNLNCNFSNMCFLVFRNPPCEILITSKKITTKSSWHVNLCNLFCREK